jgi:hypothetical protein
MSLNFLHHIALSHFERSTCGNQLFMKGKGLNDFQHGEFQALAIRNDTANNAPETSELVPEAESKAWSESQPDPGSRSRIQLANHRLALSADRA